MEHVHRNVIAAAFVVAFTACASGSPRPANQSPFTQNPSSASAAEAPNARGGGLPIGAAASTFQGELSQLAMSNTAFRRVLFTGTHTQLVAMSLAVGENIGIESHALVEQIFVIVAGNATVFLGGEVTEAGAGEVIIVRPGIRHDVRNAGLVPLKLLTVYSPPEHIPGRVQQTKAAAEADVENKAFGDVDE